MRPRNVLTETNDIRKIMGLPLLNENDGHTIEDVKKKVLNESTIEYEDDQWLVVDKEEDKEEDKEDLDETTEAEETEEEGVGAPVNDMVEEQDDYDEPQDGDGSGPGGLGDPADAQVFAEQSIQENTTGGSFAKYNITLED